jgi:hypothetical protein
MHMWARILARKRAGSARSNHRPAEDLPLSPDEDDADEQTGEHEGSPQK